jgi:hypothetical protein
MADITDNEDQQRFETTIDGRLAELTYRLEGDRMVLTHTGVPSELGGRGLGGELVRAAAARAQAQGLTIVPRCSYARDWLEKNAGETAGLAVDWGGR